MTDQAFPFVNPRGWRDRAARAAARKLYDVNRVDARGQRAVQVERQRLTAVLVDAENEAPRHIAIVQSRDTSYEAKLIAQRRLEELGENATEAAERLAQLGGPLALKTPDPRAAANAQLDATALKPEAHPTQAEPPQAPAPVRSDASVLQPTTVVSPTGEAQLPPNEVPANAGQRVAETQTTSDAGQSADANAANPAVTQDAAVTQAPATETKPKTKTKAKTSA